MVVFLFCCAMFFLICLIITLYKKEFSGLALVFWVMFLLVIQAMVYAFKNGV